MKFEEYLSESNQYGTAGALVKNFNLSEEDAGDLEMDINMKCGDNKKLEKLEDYRVEVVNKGNDLQIKYSMDTFNAIKKSSAKKKIIQSEYKKIIDKLVKTYQKGKPESNTIRAT